MQSPAKFIRQVRQEMDKVTWPKRREVMVSTAMVLVLMTFLALFFMAVDGIIAFAVELILGLGG